MKTWLTILTLFITTAIFAQKNISLEDVLRWSGSQTFDFHRAEKEFQISFWQYRYHLSNNRPRLMFNGDLPNFSRTIIPVTQNDGVEAFRERSLATSLVELSIAQNIASTGTTIFASSQLNRIDVFQPTNAVSYLAYPALLGIRQPLGSFNAMRWENKIQPIRYQESQKKFKEDVEMAKVKSMQLFFQLLLEQENLQLLEKQKIFSDSLFLLAKKRFSVGKITENELLRNEINHLQTEQELMQARNQYEFALRQFQSYFKINESVQLHYPQELQAEINLEIALERFRKNSRKSIEIQRKIIEADKELAQARANAGLKADISLAFGLSKDGQTIRDVYRQVKDQENARVSFQIPILDWQRGKSQVRVAQLQKEMILQETEREMQEMELELELQIKNWFAAQKQLDIAKKNQMIAQKVYQMTYQEYLNGNTNLSELERAFASQSLSKQNYLKQLETIWIGYYKIRLLTLYDFEKNLPLD
ncbi:TolC family protein [Raineya orbicola]|uniref:Outer membrane efflux protein n=1 Tax=Raineya orbicola TaxID=2016530 RepID=A0A2N3I9V1_9BACT|nr:TolC family protein [Raineya orbicola]PKQ67065.1 Outer membrane efflux protein [Raineya orbicola]